MIETHMKTFDEGNKGGNDEGENEDKENGSRGGIDVGFEDGNVVECKERKKDVEDDNQYFWRKTNKILSLNCPKRI